MYGEKQLMLENHNLMSKNFLAIAITEYSLKLQAERYIKLYQQIL